MDLCCCFQHQGFQWLLQTEYSTESGIAQPGAQPHFTQAEIERPRSDKPSIVNDFIWGLQLEEHSQARFSDSFATILRAHMDGLKTREKTRSKPAAKK